jgi:Ca2+-binding RTX toxin-like protein
MRRMRLSVETLEGRAVPAVFAEVGFGTLTVFGDGLNNEIVISRDELGVIYVNGEVPLAGGIPGGFPTVFNTFQITVFGAGGNDVLRLDETNGPLPSAALFGGSGDDVLTGGSSDDALHGQTGNDAVTGNGGDDDVFLGSGDDVFLRSGDDGSDRVEGQSGNDLLRVTGSAAGEAVELSKADGRLRVTHDAALIDAAGLERVAISLLGGDDTITMNDLAGSGLTDTFIDLGEDGASDAVVLNGTDGIDLFDGGAGFGEQVIFTKSATLRITGSDGPLDQFRINGRGEFDRIDLHFFTTNYLQVVIDGGAGDDSITGTQGDDVLFGGDGRDTLRGAFGDDVLFGGADNDTLLGQTGDDVLDGGDGHDLVNGGPGDDVLLNGEINIDE